MPPMRSVVAALCAAPTLLVLLLAAPAAHASGPGLDRGERAVVRVINHVRHRHGLARLHAGRRLARAADSHSRNMLARDFFAHGAFGQRVRRFVPYHRLGENLAMTSRCNPRLVVRLWMHSPPHRGVLLSRSYRRVGIGRRTGRLGSRRACMWTADFASRH
jgi:uncharacterized protein YkwD